MGDFLWNTLKQSIKLTSKKAQQVQDAVNAKFLAKRLRKLTTLLLIKNAKNNLKV